MTSPLSYEQMLAIILYTDTILYSALRYDEIQFSMQNVTVKKRISSCAAMADIRSNIKCCYLLPE